MPLESMQVCSLLPKEYILQVVLKIATFSTNYALYVCTSEVRILLLYPPRLYEHTLGSSS